MSENKHILPLLIFGGLAAAAIIIAKTKNPVKDYIMKFFTLKELTKTTTGLPNVPNETQTAALLVLAKQVLDPVRELFNAPVTVNSAFRSPAVNQAVGGAANSQHLTGEAADLDSSNNAILFNLIRNKLVFDQLIWENGTDAQPAWVHVSYTATRQNRMQVLRLKNGVYYTI